MTADAAQDQDIDRDAEQSPEDTSARPEQDQATGQAGTGDDDQLDNDPLLLAQQDADDQDAEPTAKPGSDAQAEDKPADKPTATADASAEDDPDDQDQPAPAPSKPQASEADDLQALQERLPPGDWDNLSHKGRSQYLALQRATRQQQERIQAAETERQRYREDYEAVEKFVADQGLSHEDYVRGMPLIAALKRGDQRAIPVLEQQLQHLRQAHGLPAQQAAAPNLADNAELKSFLEEAEDFGIDTSKVKQLLAGTAPQSQQQPAPPPQQQQQQRPADAPAPQPAASSDAETAEFQSIYDTLTSLGVAEDQFQAHLQRILKTDPRIQQAPVGQRLGAVVRIHQQLVSQPPAPRKPAPPTLSSVGSRRPPRARTTTDDTVDPLAIAKG